MLCKRKKEGNKSERVGKSFREKKFKDEQILAAWKRTKVFILKIKCM